VADSASSPQFSPVSILDEIGRFSFRYIIFEESCNQATPANKLVEKPVKLRQKLYASKVYRENAEVSTPLENRK
jgi:hypothetical protein